MKEMIFNNIIFLSAMAGGLIFLVFIYVFDPFKWHHRRNSVKQRQAEKDEGKKE